MNRAERRALLKWQFLKDKEKNVAFNQKLAEGTRSVDYDDWNALPYETKEAIRELLRNKT